MSIPTAWEAAPCPLPKELLSRARLSSGKGQKAPSGLGTWPHRPLSLLIQKVVSTLASLALRSSWLANNSSGCGCVNLRSQAIVTGHILHLPGQVLAGHRDIIKSTWYLNPTQITEFCVSGWHSMSKSSLMEARGPCKTKLQPPQEQPTSAACPLCQIVLHRTLSATF